MKPCKTWKHVFLKIWVLVCSSFREETFSVIYTQSSERTLFGTLTWKAYSVLYFIKQMISITMYSNKPDTHISTLTAFLFKPFDAYRILFFFVQKEQHKEKALWKYLIMLHEMKLLSEYLVRCSDTESLLCKKWVLMWIPQDDLPILKLTN